MRFSHRRVAEVVGLLVLAGVLVWYFRPPPRPVDLVVPGPTPVPGPKIALVLDDVGYGKESLLVRAVNLNVPITFAVIPYSDKDRRSTSIISQSGNQILLHLPMPAPGTDLGKDYPGGIDLGMDANEIAERMAANLSRVPGAVGVNNHQGSLGTSDEELMSLLLHDIKSRELFFLDSRTTSKTVAEKIASKIGVPFVQRSVFLDNVEEPSAIRRQLEDLKRQARRHGKAVGIGHLKETTVEVLEQDLPILKAEGIVFVFVSELVEKSNP